MKKLAITIFFDAFALMLLGLIIVMSASSTYSVIRFDSVFHLFNSHLFKVGIAFFLMILFSMIPYEIYKKELIKDGVVTEEECKVAEKAWNEKLENYQRVTDHHRRFLRAIGSQRCLAAGNLPAGTAKRSADSAVACGPGDPAGRAVRGPRCPDQKTDGMWF